MANKVPLLKRSTSSSSIVGSNRSSETDTPTSSNLPKKKAPIVKEKTPTPTHKANKKAQPTLTTPPTLVQRESLNSDAPDQKLPSAVAKFLLNREVPDNQGDINEIATWCLERQERWETLSQLASQNKGALMLTDLSKQSLQQLCL